MAITRHRWIRVGERQVPVLLTSRRDPRLHTAAIILSIRTIGAWSKSVLGNSSESSIELLRTRYEDDWSVFRVPLPAVDEVAPIEDIQIHQAAGAISS